MASTMGRSPVGPDPGATFTTAAATGMVDNDATGRNGISKLSVTGGPRKNTTNSGHGGFQSYNIDIAGQTVKYGAIKATTNVGIRTNGFM